MRTQKRTKSRPEQLVHPVVAQSKNQDSESKPVTLGMQGDIVVSARFKSFVERHGLTNMVLTPTEQFVWDPGKRGPAPLPTV